MAIAPERLTEEQFKALGKERGKVELVDGEVVEVPTTLRHEDIGMNLTLLLGNPSREYGRLFGSSAGYRMANGNIRSPDLSFVRTERLPGGEAPEEFGDGAPDFAVEILSPSERPADVLRKVAEYFESGAQEIWIVVPEAQTVTVYSASLSPQTVSGDSELGLDPLIPGFRCRVADLFATG